MPFRKVDRRSVIRDGIAGITGASAMLRAPGALAEAMGPTAGSRPNLILFMTDECRADALSSYGNPVCKTPNFDLLARQGTRFADCHVQYPVCGASRCSLLTGLPVANTGHRSLYYFIRPDEPNMLRYLKESGYDTYLIGKNDALAEASFPLSLTNWLDFPWRGGGGHTRFDLDAPNTMLVDAKPDPRQTNDYKLLQSAIQILERRQQDRPFCIFLAIGSPHPPYFAPQGFADMYKPDDLPDLAPPGLSKKPIFHEVVRKGYHLDEVGDAVFRQVRATYYGQVSYADWLLGQLMEALERTGRSRDTVLVASSDHGDYAGDYGMVEKWPGGLESCLTRVPLVIRMPGGAEGHVVPEMTELYDIMPTFLDLGAVRPKQAIFARSLLPQLGGAKGDPERAAYTESGYDTFEPQAFEPRMKGPPNIYTAKHEIQNDFPQTVTRAAAITTPAYKLVSRPNGQSELYDRKKDPAELVNLIDDRRYARTREALTHKLLDRYISTTGVPPVERDSREVPPDPPMPQFDNAASVE
ncbi:sulfatase-like hydrolase/transferase [Novosphingobium sp. PP1Y]|uniref:sulfatase-like hydrolase/transferase n=1 Tax=Novosphingobium sp. PP1Y TaxID=702113 RepID=UPI0003141B93|nr:sulfatase-like hydrolase/transferase [Novosphingobium sp. PP1Y]